MDARLIADMLCRASADHRRRAQAFESRLTDEQRRALISAFSGNRYVAKMIMERAYAAALRKFGNAVKFRCDAEELDDPLSTLGEDLTPVRPPPSFLRG